MEIISPCKKICKLNDYKICMGCGRTITEIMNWNKYDETIKCEVIQRADRRISEKINIGND
jgi:predicted Fe-S protein YdhL (DUF1289 family)